MLVTSFDFVLHSDILFKSSCLRLTCRNATRRRLQCGRGDIPTGLHHDYSGHHCANFLARVTLARIQYWLPSCSRVIGSIRCALLNACLVHPVSLSYGNFVGMLCTTRKATC
jgi:hypothetical protein